MASKIHLLIFVLFISSVKSDSLFERSYEYVMNIGKNLGPTFNNLLDCFGERDAWSCTREMAGRLLDNWEKDVETQRRLWADAADAEVTSSGRSFEEMPSKLGQEIELSLAALTDTVKKGMARVEKNKHEYNKNKHCHSESLSENVTDTGSMIKSKSFEKTMTHIMTTSEPVTR
ncbi:unnamed protein product [Euphydryas editha]|uniref:Uncharacterized protein n=1 Tax=Euphydryas editha TaxID=104508 RepID=A0AAU9T8G9_EUPED|nr:unnamed protein product [Euphydryas editha]